MWIPKNSIKFVLFLEVLSQTIFAFILSENSRKFYSMQNLIKPGQGSHKNNFFLGEKHFLIFWFGLKKSQETLYLEVFLGDGSREKNLIKRRGGGLFSRLIVFEIPGEKIESQDNYLSQISYFDSLQKSLWLLQSMS